MFTQRVTESDAFTSLPFAAQALYFHLGMLADDDGFINNAKRISAMLDMPDGTLDLLIEKRFLLSFDGGVICIKHWKMHNSIKKDRYKPTHYQDELNSLIVKPNGAYTENGDILETFVLHNGDIAETNVLRSIDKNSIEEYREEKDSTNDTGANCGKPCGKVGDNSNLGKYGNVILSARELALLKVKFPDWQEKVEYLSAYLKQTGKEYSNHYDIITEWAKEDAV